LNQFKAEVKKMKAPPSDEDLQSYIDQAQKKKKKVKDFIEVIQGLADETDADKVKEGIDQFLQDSGEVSIRPDRATVVVKLPARAKLYVDNVFCPLTSAKRTFRTPRLERGRRYYYTLRVETVRNGQPVRQTRKVYLEAGKRVVVDFKSPTLVSTVKK
jgi:uncharacterized protein (TIGR03000 family)